MHFAPIKLFILPLVFTCAVFEVQASTIENLNYYETIHANDFKHYLVKRDLHSRDQQNHIKELNFRTLGRHFKLILTPKISILHSTFKAYAVEGNGKQTPINFDTDNFFGGQVLGETRSKVRVHIDNEGVIMGSLYLPEETYHIEPLWRHLPGCDNGTMITYRESDMKLGLNNSYAHQVGFNPFSSVREGLLNEEEEPEENKEWKFNSLRKRRHVYQNQWKPTKTLCPLHLVADYRFFKIMGAGDIKTTINYIISLIDQVHKIFDETIWFDEQELNSLRGMGFTIKRILVHSEPTHVRAGDLHYNMLKEEWDARNLLEVFSRVYGHGECCLAHLFTDQVFKEGVVSLAYVASKKRLSVGGICTAEYFKNGYSLYLNSGLSSSSNPNGQHVLLCTAELLTAHEFGHNWGADHDADTPECSPSSNQGGQYLMNRHHLLSGYDRNNKRFSPCSIKSIYNVLVAKSERCFSEPGQSFCGNLLVEEDEECDAGFLPSGERDSCCSGDCRLQLGAFCSDKNSPCCQNCRYAPKGLECRKARECKLSSYCTGAQAECPSSLVMPDGAGCEDRGICFKGKCVPYCETYERYSCMCDAIENACTRCCQTNTNATCLPLESKDPLPDGTPCMQGFCNKGICEKIKTADGFWDIIEDTNITTKNINLIFFYFRQVITMLVSYLD